MKKIFFLGMGIIFILLGIFFNYINPFYNVFSDRTNFLNVVLTIRIILFSLGISLLLSLLLMKFSPLLKENTKKKIIFITILILLFCVILFRVYDLRADPPDDISSSAGIFTDERVKALEAREKIFFGNWLPVDWEEGYFNHFYAYPLLVFFDYLSFYLFGVGAIQLKLIPIFFSILTLILIYLLMKEFYNERVAILSVVLLGLNYTYLFYSRIALPFIPMIFFIVLSIFFFCKGKQRSFYYFISGFSVFLAFLFHPFALFFIPAGLITSLYWLRSRKKDVFIYISGFLIFFVFLTLFFYLPYFEQIKSNYIIHDTLISSSHLIPSTLVRMGSNMINVFSSNNIFLLSPIIFILGFFYLFTNKSKNEFVFFMKNWLIWGSLLVSLYAYKPMRYYVFLIIPLTILTVLYLDNLGNNKKYNNWLLLLFSGIISLAVVNRFLFPLLDTNILKILFSLIFVFAVFFITLTILKIKLNDYDKKYLFLFIVLSILIIQITHYVIWVGNREYSIGYISDDLEKVLNQDDRVIGDASELLFDKKIKTVKIHYIDDNSIDRYNATHVLFVEKFQTQLKDSDKIKNGELIRTYELKYLGKIMLYKLK